VKSTDLFSPLIKDNKRLEILLEEIPNEVGCYLMHDNNERLLYVGKSKKLRNRVRSYFRNIKDHSPRINLMIRQIYDIEYIITDSENEALTLESNLIKSQQPYFNVLLKDGKKYPYICITWSEKYPRIFITRRRRQLSLKDKFYGPFVDVTLLRNTLFWIKNAFPLRQRSKPLFKDRTCLNYSIGRCPGVCQELITIEEYFNTLKRVEMIFQGRSEELKKILSKKMHEYSLRMEYESALKLREQIKGLDNISQSQKMIIPDSSTSRDIIALAYDNKTVAIQLFQMRTGKLVGRLGYISQNNQHSIQETMQKIVEEHYSQVDNIELPNEILLQHKLPQQDLISEWLTQIRGKKVRLMNPKKNNKVKLVDLVEKNALIELNRIQRCQDRHLLGLEDLSQTLDLIKPPRRIEGYDISHIQGTDVVGSQVVFIDGIPAKEHYRKYKIKLNELCIGHSDDFKSLSELIRRRLKRWSKYKSEGGSLSELKNKKISLFDNLSLSDLPDLLLIDGGKGQLSSVVNVLKELDLFDDIPICSIAKKNEEIFIPNTKQALVTEKDDLGIILLRRVRDEAHRFAVSFHKQQRSARMTRSQLTHIPGVGSKRLNELLDYFQSVDALKMATKNEILNVPGIGEQIAEKIWDYYNNVGYEESKSS
tara:strand:- start:3028 stop:4977 length:1950 start_codon:yes stop_codon:yes gene_type:complete